ncbi:MAG: hypothetical protein ACREBZ_07880, partial [Thermoplasmata archaeon]
LDERLEITAESGVLGDGPLAATTGPPDAREILPPGGRELPEAAGDRSTGDARGSVDLGDAAPADRPGLRREEETTLTLVERGQ